MFQLHLDRLSLRIQIWLLVHRTDDYLAKQPVHFLSDKVSLRMVGLDAWFELPRFLKTDLYR